MTWEWVNYDRIFIFEISLKWLSYTLHWWPCSLAFHVWVQLLTFWNPIWPFECQLDVTHCVCLCSTHASRCQVAQTLLCFENWEAATSPFNEKWKQTFAKKWPRPFIRTVTKAILMCSPSFQFYIICLIYSFDGLCWEVIALPWFIFNSIWAKKEALLCKLFFWKPPLIFFSSLFTGESLFFWRLLLLVLTFFFNVWYLTVIQWLTQYNQNMTPSMYHGLTVWQYRSIDW